MLQSTCVKFCEEAHVLKIHVLKIATCIKSSDCINQFGTIAIFCILILSIIMTLFSIYFNVLFINMYKYVS